MARTQNEWVDKAWCGPAAYPVKAVKGLAPILGMEAFAQHVPVKEPEFGHQTLAIGAVCLTGTPPFITVAVVCAAVWCACCASDGVWLRHAAGLLWMHPCTCVVDEVCIQTPYTIKKLRASRVGRLVLG